MTCFNDTEWLKSDMEQKETEVELIETGFIKLFRRIVAEANAVTGGCGDVVDAMIDANNRICDMVEIVEMERAIYEGRRKKYLEAVAREAQKEKENSAADAFANIADEADKFVKAADAFTAAYKEAVAEGGADADHE